MNRTYKVVARPVGGHPKNAEITDADLPAGTNVQALVDGGLLKVTGVEKADCPACVEQGKKRPPKFQSIEELRGHYAEAHAGLEPPREEE